MTKLLDLIKKNIYTGKSRNFNLVHSSVIFFFGILRRLGIWFALVMFTYVIIIQISQVASKLSCGDSKKVYEATHQDHEAT
jgi:hypothetical protein